MIRTSVLPFRTTSIIECRERTFSSMSWKAPTFDAFSPRQSTTKRKVPIGVLHSDWNSFQRKCTRIKTLHFAELTLSYWKVIIVQSLRDLFSALWWYLVNCSLSITQGSCMILTLDCGQLQYRRTSATLYWRTSEFSISRQKPIRMISNNTTIYYIINHT